MTTRSELQRQLVRIAYAAGIRDPYGKQKHEFEVLARDIRDICRRRFERHGIPINYNDLVDIARIANQNPINFVPRFRKILLEYTLRRIEEAHKVTAPPSGTLQDALAEMEKYFALEGG